MYDNNIFNDVNYLLNKSVLFSENLNVLNRTIRKTDRVNMDVAFSSEKDFYFSEYSAVQSASNDPIDFNEKELYEKFKSGVSSLEDVVIIHIARKACILRIIKEQCRVDIHNYTFQFLVLF